MSETNTLPWSITMVSGTMTGLAAAFSNRASTAISRWCGRIESAIARVWLQPGRIGSGTSILASSTAASTPFVPAGLSRAAQIVRVVTSTAIVSSRAGHDPVVQHHHHVQPCGVDPHDLPRAGGPAPGDGQGEPSVKWNLRMVAAQRDLWRPTEEGGGGRFVRSRDGGAGRAHCRPTDGWGHDHPLHSARSAGGGACSARRCARDAGSGGRSTLSRERAYDAATQVTSIPMFCAGGVRMRSGSIPMSGGPQIPAEALRAVAS